METKEMYWNGMLIRKDRASKVYQEMCDEVFGKNTVHIERGVMNRVLMHLMFVDSFGSFQDYLKALLERLNKKMTSAGAEFELLMQVEAVADPWWGEYAFAKLNGVIVIDMAAEEGKVICHSFGNPNSAVWDEMDEMTLHKVVNNGDINGVCDTFDHDNY